MLLENGFDELHEVDWDKGCYVGQEVTARMRYRGLVKRRLVPVRFDGPAPAAGTSVMSDGKTVGAMRSAAVGLGTAGLGLADLRLDAADARDLTADGAPLTALIPDWLMPALKDG